MEPSEASRQGDILLGELVRVKFRLHDSVCLTFMSYVYSLHQHLERDLWLGVCSL